jgi:DNA-binding transcriptional regulator YdaS (Cro superfamily)
MKNPTAALIKKALKVTKLTNYGLAHELSVLAGRPVPPPAVYNWKRGTPVSPSLCHAFQVLTKGQVMAHELRPDIFPAPGEELPALKEPMQGKRHARHS